MGSVWRYETTGNSAEAGCWLRQWGKGAQKAEVTEEGKRSSEGVRQRALVTDF